MNSDGARVVAITSEKKCGGVIKRDKVEKALCVYEVVVHVDRRLGEKRARTDRRS